MILDKRIKKLEQKVREKVRKKKGITIEVTLGNIIQELADKGFPLETLEDNKFREVIQSSKSYNDLDEDSKDFTFRLINIIRERKRFEAENHI